MAPKQKRRTKPGEFNYTKPQGDEILAALRKAGLPKDADHTHILSRITEIARLSLTGKALQDELHTPAVKRVRAKIRRATKGVETLLASMEALSPEMEFSEGGHLITTTSDPDVSKFTIVELRSLIAYMVKWGEPPTYRGRREKGLERTFVRSLSYIYFSWTGRVPSRQNDPVTNKARGPFRAFVQAAMDPTGLLPEPTTVDHLIRQVIPKFLRDLNPSVMVKIPPSAR